MSVKCDVCFRHCELKPGQTGACGARINADDQSVASCSYGWVTGLALDPIEKKPLYRFHPGSRILSVGSFGCNLKCPFCQNVDISMADGRMRPEAERVSPEELADMAYGWRNRGNVGVAFTYNEPLVGYEYVRDAARLVHERGMLNVVVTNGSASPWVLDELEPYVDAMNVDLKCFNPDYYRDVLKGDMETTLNFIERAVSFAHVELTTLIIPGENDGDDEMRRLSAWVAGLEVGSGRRIPLHVTRFFPRSRYADRTPTEVSKVYHLAAVARENLEWVYEGNV